MDPGGREKVVCVKDLFNKISARTTQILITIMMQLVLQVNLDLV